MAQATSTHTSRRVFLRGAVAAPALALPTIALASPDVELVAMEAELTAVNARHEAALDVFNVAERAYLKWRRKNPEPEYQLPTSAYSEKDDKMICVRGEDPFVFSARRNDWREREARVRKRSGMLDAEADTTGICNEIGKIRDRMVGKSATSIEGLRVKARSAQSIGCDGLAWSVIDDLIAMGA